MKPDMKTRHLSENQTIDSHGHLSRNGPLQPPKNSTTVMAETSTMPTYSPTKNMPNFMPEYSVWKPAASSDSASGRSNGVRCTTARSEEHTSELQSLMRISYAVFCLTKKNIPQSKNYH